jgi:hypothetical protein
MRYLVLALVLGCTAAEPEDDDVPVGADVAAATTCAANTWCAETQPIASAPLLHGVWAVSASDVFAVGDGGAILRRVNGTWTQMASGTTQNLRGVWAASSTDVWAVGVNQTILRFNGTAWSAVTGVATADVDAVWGSSSTNVWMVGGGTAYRWNGTSFSSFGFGGLLLSVGGTGPSDMWVTGESTNLHHFTGSSFTTVTPISGNSTYFAVFALASNDVWAANFNSGKETMHWNGSAWSARRTGGGIWEGMAGLSATDVWGVGGTRSGHWNGTAWTLETPFGSSAQMWAVTTVAGNAWLVGDAGLIGHRTF